MSVANKFILIAPSTRGISLALTRHLLYKTQLPLFATYRKGTAEEAKEHILSSPLLKTHKVDHGRLQMLRMDLLNEQSIERAAKDLKQAAGPNASIETAFFTGGVLHPEKQPADLILDDITETFQINVVSHLLLIKHFSKFLPGRIGTTKGDIARWVHISARVGSVSDNTRGGWYSYRASKAALNQVIKTFDLHLQMKQSPTICVGVHPGTVRTELSREFWDSPSVGRLFEPEEAAEKIVEVIQNMDATKRGRVWDWKGEEVLP
ncbi:hypothetical protein D9757_000244 [Collybiopsis confluens]|uniref:NAD(P)-binding protein n=1 Tax=Collybiopsis confluens TaxID=2823264 RepID=A0A8H5MHF6_9AGAR|nr:hypothetical protein D9757_000244 [Collybiopsis confluens]